MERCPICRATLNGAEICRRCQTDLGRVIKVERQARGLAGEAILQAMTGDAAQARALLDRARIIRDAPDLRLLDALLWDRRTAPGEDAEPKELEQEQELEGQGEHDEGIVPFTHDESGAVEPVERFPIR